MSIDDCDVLIVGAGPVGLLLALMLRPKGVNVKIVERQRALYPLPRAVAFDHESRRLFGSLGLTEELNPILEDIMGEGGENGTNYVWRDADLKLIVDLFFEAPTRSGFPLSMGFNQPELEQLLDKTAIQRNIPIMRGYTVSALDQHADSVDVLLEPVTCKQGTTIEERDSPIATKGGEAPHTRRVRASYVVGCDGANSTVRRLQNFSMTNLDFENDWLVADILLRDGYVPPEVRKVGAAQICDPKRPTSCVWGGIGRKRFEFMRLPGESKESLLQDDTMWGLLAPWGFTKDNCDLERKVIYTFRARWVDNFVKGRVTLAGDALHQMPPFMGQGLNSGFRDAAALAWRLPLILSGVANADAVLRSYQEERLDHVSRLTVDCVQLGSVVCETDPIKAKQMHEALRKNPPPGFYDPPLGRPGILTAQPEAGHLSLQRELKTGDGQHLFDEVHGYGWMLLNLGDTSAMSQMSDVSCRFFGDVLGGKCVSISPSEDTEGEYHDWFDTHMGLDHVVLIRPDFYVFGHAAVTEVDGLVEDLRRKLSGL